MIDENEIRHIANLSMLNINDDEIEGVTESAYALDSYNVFRKDEVKESLSRDLLLQNAPSSNGEAFSLPSMN